MFGLTRSNLRHIGLLLKQSKNPATVVYNSLGSDFPLALAPGWLNLGLWEGKGDPEEAETAVRRLVETLAEPLPRNGVIVDVGNGLGAQDPVIANYTRARQLIAVNITESQLWAGKHYLEEANAQAVLADATVLPLADNSADGIISVEAAFHFSSRAAFFAECARILRPGGVLSFSDISAEGMPSSVADALWGLAGVRVWGLQRSAMVPAAEIAGMIEDVGLKDVRLERCGSKVIDPAFRFLSSQLEEGQAAQWQQWAGRVLVKGWSELRRKGLVDYVLLTAVAP
jgi:SAM-dependent methyltransferase